MPDPKQVLFVHHSADLYGSDKVLLCLVSRLDRTKLHPIVLLPFEGPLANALHDSGVEVHIVPLVRFSRAGLSWRALVRLPWEVLRSIRSINSVLEEKHIYLVHSNTLAVFSGAIWAKLKRVPHVWHVHEIVERPGIVRKGLAWLAYAFADKVVCISGAVRNHLLKDMPALAKKSVVVWNGLDRNGPVHPERIQTFKKQLALGGNDVIVALVGRINRWKGQRLLVDAANLLWERGVVNICYLIVGSPIKDHDFFLDNLLAHVQGSPARGKITVIPFQEDIWTIWDSCDIAVVPSTEPEPFGMVALEAMAAGKPVIAVDHGGLSEIILDGETGLLVEPRNPTALADALEMLVNDSSMRNEFGARGQERAHGVFDQHRQVSLMERIYESIAAGGNLSH